MMQWRQYAAGGAFGPQPVPVRSLRSLARTAGNSWMSVTICAPILRRSPPHEEVSGPPPIE